MSDPCPPDDHDYAPWVHRLVALPPVVFAVASLMAPSGSWASLGARHDAVWAVALAVTVSVLPWLLMATGRRVPDAVFAVWVVVPLAALNLAGGAVGVDLSGASHTQFSLMILVWLVGEFAAAADARLAAAVTVVSIAVMAGRSIVEPTFGHSWMFWAGGAGIALVTGYMLRRQQETLAALRQAQAELAEEAVQHERQRIAREVHDVVAHTLTVTLMHLQAARRALDHDVEDARAALRDAETHGRRSLADVRRSVGLLRARGEVAETRALPDTSDLPALLDAYRRAGVELDARVDLAGAELTPAAALTLYRLVQESLSNAVAHAPGAPIALVVQARDGDVVLEVTNPVTGPHGADSGRDGLGLIGMEERVQLLGGSFDASRHGDRWVVSARIATVDADGDVEVLT